MNEHWDVVEHVRKDAQALMSSPTERVNRADPIVNSAASTAIAEESRPSVPESIIRAKLIKDETFMNGCAYGGLWGGLLWSDAVVST
eukprot:9478175-Pyramimonas_sp.AAC.1